MVSWAVPFTVTVMSSPGFGGSGETVIDSICTASEGEPVYVYGVRKEPARKAGVTLTAVRVRPTLGYVNVALGAHCDLALERRSHSCWRSRSGEKCAEKGEASHGGAESRHSLQLAAQQGPTEA